MNGNSIPKATLGRLPLYLQYLQDLSNEIVTVSATTIAKELGLGEVQVRKDLASVSGAGKPKIGYVTRDLVADITASLGGDRLVPAVLVGAGKLGKALLCYDGFEEFGVDIVAAFDRCESEISVPGTNKPILPVSELSEFCAARNIRLGVISVGRGSAQEVCDLMVSCGVTAIWNFAPCHLSTPSGITVKHENLALSLAHLANGL